MRKTNSWICFTAPEEEDKPSSAAVPGFARAHFFPIGLDYFRYLRTRIITRRFHNSFFVRPIRNLQAISTYTTA